MSLHLLSWLLHAYVALRIGFDLPPVAGFVFGVLMAASAALLPFGLGRRRRAGSRRDEVLTWAGLVLMGLFSSLFVLTLLRDLAIGAFAIAEGVLPGFDVRTAFVRDSAYAVPLLGALASLWGFANARRTPRIARVDVALADLPPALEGFTIAQISDVHVGPTIKGGFVQAIVEAVNRERPDVVAITGDLVDGSVRELAGHVAPLAALEARHGSYFVTGNHEYYSGAEPWVRELGRLGVKVLMNEHVLIRQGGAELVLGGVTDFGAHHFAPGQRSDPAAALAGAPAHAPKVLLAHQPRSADAAERAGFDLQLSGHTHGGQFLPWNLFVPLQQPFTAGLHRWGRMWVYTSRGTGYWGPPKRFGAPSEITLLRLVRASSSDVPAAHSGAPGR
ncbi:metallophosphoesterase [Piscinibacter koreensis]|uniref:metallophosphoesterase n=1 Tax=Piscinibacter koreensis TaxID=2742824 RepID=UPI001C375C91|nr:metallophosphoesterase [Schlegelella koreensis]